jgi:cytochrome P450
MAASRAALGAILVVTASSNSVIDPHRRRLCRPNCPTELTGSSVTLPRRFGDSLWPSIGPGMERTPPSASRLPLVDVVPRLIREPHDFLLGARARYGDIYTLNLGPARLVVLNHPDHARHLLVESARAYVKAGPVWDLLRSVIGNGLATSDGESWLRQRRMMQPHFSRQHLAELTDVMLEAIDEGIASLDRLATTGERFDLVHVCNLVTINVLMKAIFGTHGSPREMSEISRAVTFVLEYATWALIGSTLPRWLPLPARRRYEAHRLRIDEYMSSVIAERRRRPARSIDLITWLLQAREAGTGRGLSDHEVRDEAFTIFMAGYETTSLALAWTVCFLAQRPELAERVRREVDAVCGSRPPAFDDLPRLTYGRMALQETLRMRPPAFWLPRTAAVDDRIDGYDIPAGTSLALLIFGVHHHPDFWDEPLIYRPERFDPERAAQITPHSWIPFGDGQRLCIGRDFAMLEAQLVLSAIMQRYEVSMASGRRVRARFLSTLRPRGGVPVTVRRRQPPLGPPSAV